MALSDLFRRKSLADAVARERASQTGLKRTLGAFDLTMLGIGAIIGAGLFSSIGDMTRAATSPTRRLGAGPGDHALLRR